MSGFSRTVRDSRNRIGSVSALAFGMKLLRFVPLTTALLFSGACLVGGAITPTLDAPTAQQIGRLWQDPGDLSGRDLFRGSGGAELLPPVDGTFQFLKADQSGYSAGYDVRDAEGLEWSVKLGPEAQTEVVVSRILWALGYHQPPTYYLSSWAMTGEKSGLQPAARFRPKLATWNVVGEWSWYENDFINTQPFKGLVVINVMLNNWDWKTSNNKIYEIREEGQLDRVYVVQDLGASLGKTAYPQVLSWLPMRGLGQGSRNDLEDFEEQGFIKSVEGERVEFVYRGIHRSLLERLTPGDVVWAAELMSRLTDEQWRDAFRAAGYSDDDAGRFIAKIKSKIAEGLQLAKPEVRQAAGS